MLDEFEQYKSVIEYLLNHFDELKKDILNSRLSIPNKLETDQYVEEFITILKFKVARALNASYGEIDITEDCLTQLFGSEWKNS